MKATVATLAMLAAWAASVGAAPTQRADTPLLVEDYERSPGVRLRVRGADKAYRTHALGLSTERPHSGRRCARVDVTHEHGFSLYLAPRSNGTPRVEWGTLDLAGLFTLKGLGLPLRAHCGYLLRLWLRVERASPQNPVSIAVITASECDYGTVRTETQVGPVFSAPTPGWVRIEEELSSSIVEQLAATGARTQGLRLDAVCVRSFGTIRNRLTVCADDLSVSELPRSAAQAWRARRQRTPRPAVPSFRRFPDVEDQFTWGVYGDLLSLGQDWYRPYPRGGDTRRE